MKLNITQEEYENYLKKNDTVRNARIRESGENFFDALLSEDMTKTPEGREILTAIGDLQD